MSYKFIKTILIICLLVYSNVESAIAHAEDNLGYAKDSSIFSKSPNENQNSDNDSIPDLLVFASFSIPEHSLKQLSEQVKKAKGVLVIRGLYKGSLKETINKIYALNKQGVPAIIHPKFFKEFSVTKVPTFVLRDRSNLCIEEKSCTAIFDKLPLGYALRLFEKEGYNIELAKKYADLLASDHE